MKYFLLFVSLVATVSSKEDWTRAGTARRFPFPALFAKSMGLNAESHVKDASYYSNDVIERDWISLGVLLDIGDDIKRKCSASSVPDHQRIFEEASNNYKECIKKVNHLQGVSSRDSPTDDFCRYSVETNQCFIQFTEELQPCLPGYNGGYFPYSSIVQAFFNYTCGDENAKERLKDNAMDAVACLSDKLAPKEGCGKIPQLGETSYTYSESDCKIASDYWTCVATETTVCTPKVLDYLKGLGHAVAQFYEPCPSNRRAIKGHLPSWMGFLE